MISRVQFRMSVACITALVLFVAIFFVEIQSLRDPFSFSISINQRKQQSLMVRVVGLVACDGGQRGVIVKVGNIEHVLMVGDVLDGYTLGEIGSDHVTFKKGKIIKSFPISE